MCSVCGMTAPWHRQDCLTIAGGAEQRKRDEAYRARWAAERYVPRDRGARVLRQIMAMMGAPNQREMLRIKGEILSELGTLG